MLGQGKPEKHPVYKFFTNGFVQGVAVFIALAVAFSGKLDSKGTLVAVLVAGVVGAMGIYAHCSNSARQRIVATISILLYGCALSAFNSYLTSKPTVSAGNTTIQQQDAKPSETKPEEKKPDKKEQDAKKQEPKPRAKAEQPSQGPTVGNITQGPCSNVQVGGSNNTATTNCVSPSRVMTDDKAIKQLTRDFAQIPHLNTSIFPAGISDDVQPVFVQLCNILIDASWRPNCQGLNGASIGGMRMPAIEGIQCFSDSWNTGTQALVRAALDGAGFGCTYISHPFTTNGTFGGQITIGGIVILIGTRSP